MVKKYKFRMIPSASPCPGPCLWAGGRIYVLTATFELYFHHPVHLRTAQHDDDCLAGGIIAHGELRRSGRAGRNSVRHSPLARPCASFGSPLVWSTCTAQGRSCSAVLVPLADAVSQASQPETVLPPLRLGLAGIGAAFPKVGLMLMQFAVLQATRRKLACHSISTSFYRQIANLFIEVGKQVLGCWRSQTISQSSKH